MSEITPFDFKGATVRTLIVDGDPWFVASDVCSALGYVNPRDAVSKHIDPEDKGVVDCDTLGGRQKVAAISESGVYALIFGSHLPAAKDFKRWVTSDVLPSIRKTGVYAPRDDLSMLRGMIDAIEADRNRVAALEKKSQEIEARTSALEENHDRVTAIGWANLRKARSDVSYLNALGRRASRIARRDEVPVSRAHSTVWGEVNAWPLEIWDEASVGL